MYDQSSSTSMAKFQIIYQKPNQNHDPAQKLFIFAQARAPNPFTSPVVLEEDTPGTWRPYSVNIWRCGIVIKTHVHGFFDTDLH